MFDRFWGLIQEAKIVVASHGGVNVGQGPGVALLEADVRRAGRRLRAYAAGMARNSMSGSPILAMTKGRSIHDFCFMIVAHRLFERFPGVRMAIIENGSNWVLPLLNALEYLDHGGGYKQNPREQFIEHCWVTPYPEDTLDMLVQKFPTNRILFGSDWPHGEGFVEPTDFYDIINNNLFSDVDKHRIMRDNARELTLA